MSEQRSIFSKDAIILCGSTESVLREWERLLRPHADERYTREPSPSDLEALRRMDGT